MPLKLTYCFHFEICFKYILSTLLKTADGKNMIKEDKTFKFSFLNKNMNISFLSFFSRIGVIKFEISRNALKRIECSTVQRATVSSRDSLGRGVYICDRLFRILAHAELFDTYHWVQLSGSSIGQYFTF